MKSGKQIRFINKDKNLFFVTLKKRIDTYFKENNISRHANSTMFIKTITLMVGYLVPFAYLLIATPTFNVALMIWAVMGVCVAGIGMSVMHDANHGAYSDNQTVNAIVGHSLNLLGGAVFNWNLQHNVLHHMYTNISGVDDDIADRAVLRFSPHTKVKWYQSIQYCYAFFFYGLLTLYWVVAKDFIQFAKYTKEGVNPNSFGQNVAMLGRIIASKVIYLGIFVFTPIFFFNIPTNEVLWGFLLMHFIAGVILTTIFQLAHTVEGTTHPLLNENGNIENDWAIHQMNTTVNFSRNNKLISWYVGGLNFQVEHHLFPKICHVHYPAIAPIVKETAEEFGIPYLENKTFGQALQSHINTLYRFGRLPDLNEALA
jgi:linoleoyl-CoA desaturase